MAHPWPAGLEHLEHFERTRTGRPSSPIDFYGFDHVELAIDHGPGHRTPPALGAGRGGSYEDLVVPDDGRAPRSNAVRRLVAGLPTALRTRASSTSFVTDRTIASSRKPRPERSRGWHGRRSPIRTTRSRRPASGSTGTPDDMELSSTIDDPMEHAPSTSVASSRSPPPKQRSWVSPVRRGRPRRGQEAIAATYGMIEMIDDGVGQILAALERSAQLDDTIVVFTSDHGDMMGDHGLMLKGCMHYKGTLQVPMVIADPQTPGRTTVAGRQHRSGPTLLDLAGSMGTTASRVAASCPSSTTRRLSVRTDAADRGRHADVYKTPIPYKTRTVVGGRNEVHTTQHGEDQLFDLKADPDEMVQFAPVDPARRADPWSDWPMR